MNREEERAEKRNAKSLARITHADTFCQELRKGKTLSAAYRKTFPDKAEAWSDATIHNAASLFAKTDEVIERHAELRGIIEKKTLVTVETLTEELEEARFVASLTSNPSAMTQATMGKAKIHGIGQEKVELNLADELIGLIMGDLPDTTGLPEPIEGEIIERTGT